MNRLEQQLHFLIEADKLKSVLRRSTLICDNERRENDAEHSWHLTLCAVLLLEYAVNNETLDMLRVIKMLIIHDMVEIEAGDTYCYDDVGLQDQEQRENAAAENLFSLLPDDQRKEFFSLWKEFEGKHTPEAKYAAVIDRLQPLLQIYFSNGNTWIENGIDLERELERNKILSEVTPDIWEYAKNIIYNAAKKGWLIS